MRWLAALMLTCLPLSAMAQEWQGLLALSAWQYDGAESAPFILPDNAQESAATEAVVIGYPVIVGAAGNFSITVGHYRRSGGVWQFAGQVKDLFGTGPREPEFTPDGIFLTTTMLKEGEPRCCPTGVVRWRIDRASLQATKVSGP